MGRNANAYLGFFDGIGVRSVLKVDYVGHQGDQAGNGRSMAVELDVVEVERDLVVRQRDIFSVYSSGDESNLDVFLG